jgi:transmembrane sensor
MSAAERIEAEAAAWISRRDDEGWCADDAAELAAWLDADDAHRVAFWRLEQGWRRLERLGVLRRGAAPPPVSAPGRRRVWPLAGALAAGLALLVLAPQTSRDPVHRSVRFETARGQQRTVALSDGSRIELNTDSDVIADVTSAGRAVQLVRGEAYFDIQHDATRPFVVYAAGRKVTVLGTSFSVRLAAGETRLVVTRGRVRLAPEGARDPSPTEDVAAGQMALAHDRSVLIASVTDDRAADLLSWRTGMLTFEEATLGDVATEINRYNERQLVIVDPAAAQIRIGGSFEARNLDGFVRLMQSAYGLRAANKEDRIIISGPT